MGLILGENLKSLRKEKGISQETLAEYLGISVQAVSKWENNLSYPDIEFLPTLANYYEVTVDYLLTGNSIPKEKTTFYASNNGNGVTVNLPNDNVHRILQFKGNELLNKDTYNNKTPILLQLKANDKEYTKVNLEIWGSADIKGNIDGDVCTGLELNCGSINGDANAGLSLNAGNISGDANAGLGLNCGNVGGDVNAGNAVNCGNITGDLSAGNSVNCGDIHGDVTVNGDLHCSKINGDVSCEGDIYYKNK